MTTNGTQTAEVETLTATVRVLMVGSRQVTLSVAKQLDIAAMGEMEPFGRIRLSEVCLIGRRIKDGALVRTDGMPYTTWAPNISELPTKATVCRHLALGKDSVTLLYNKREIMLWPGCYNLCDEALGHGRYSDTQCGHWSVNGNEAAIESQIAEHDAYVSAAKAAQALPLIVLAGLK